MNERMRLTVFPCRNPEGERLAEAVRLLGEKWGYEVHVPASPSQGDFLLSCLKDRAVVVDGSIEPGCEAVYAVAVDHPKWLEHALVVSRTHLPLNFFGARGGGAPLYPYPHKQSYPSPGDPWNNGRILEWLDRQLLALRDDPAGTRLNLQRIEDLRDNSEQLHALLRQAHERRAAAQRRQRRVFISYRGAYYERVRELAARIANGEFHPGEKPEVVVLQPGELAYDRELLSEVRRWQVLNLLDDRLRSSTELWVFRTRDYLESWWTVGELVIAAWIGVGGKPPPRIRIYDPERDHVTDSAGEYIVTLSEVQERRFARYASAAHPDTMGPEHLDTLRMMRSLVNSGMGEIITQGMMQAARDPTISAMMRSMLPGAAAEKEKLWSELMQLWGDPEQYQKYLNDPVHSEEFWEHLALERGAHVLDPATGRIDVERFLDVEGRLARAIPSGDVASAAEHGRPLKLYGREIHVQARAPRYFWEASRVGGAIGGRLIPVPIFVQADPDS
jgi:hypothetical protein